MSLDNLLVKEVAPGIHAYYRPNSSDERVLTEVIETRIYRRKKIDFDVERGETWLDLGANIGAFALYCKSRGAVAECYEPDPPSYAVLTKNVPEFKRHLHAVTNSEEPTLEFWSGRLANDYYRSTAYPTTGLRKHPNGRLMNKHGRIFEGRVFDGVKMDIEGAEFGLLDDDLLPRCQKLVMEYHTSRDASAKNLERRLAYLRSRFAVLSYPPEYDRIVVGGVDTKTYFDRMVFCRN